MTQKWFGALSFTPNNFNRRHSRFDQPFAAKLELKQRPNPIQALANPFFGITSKCFSYDA